MLYGILIGAIAGFLAGKLISSTKIKLNSTVGTVFFFPIRNRPSSLSEDILQPQIRSSQKFVQS